MLENLFWIFCNPKNVKKKLHQKMFYHGKMGRNTPKGEWAEKEK